MTDPDTTDDDGEGVRLSRRRSLAVLAGLTGLAGCGSGGGGGTDAPTDSPTEASNTLPPTDTIPGNVEVVTGSPTPTEVPTATAWKESQDPQPGPARRVEDLDRGLVAVSVKKGVYLKWRLLGTEPRDLGFNVYRDGEQVNDDPVTATTNYLDEEGSADATYTVRPVTEGGEGEESKPADVWDQSYLEIPLQKPGPVTHADPDDDSQVIYSANDASVGDLTGNGRYDIVLKWSPSNAKDNAFSGFTNQHIVDGYTMEGEHLWRIELGKNVRAGAHYLPYLVYDFDGDGKSEVVMRTSDGTTDGAGNVIGDPDADYRNSEGYILEGPEYLTVFDGETGEELATTGYKPARGDVSDWGDDYGNRVDRFLAGVAYLDGERPSIVMTRGYYDKTMLAAFDYRNGEITERWVFDSADGKEEYEGKGAHSLATADLDGDGKDEIVFGGAAFDHDGTGLHTTSMQNPDAQHCGEFIPDREGLEIFVPAESPPAGAPSASMRDGETGEYIWSVDAGDVPRAMVSDIDPNYEGAEAWALGGVGTWTADGEQISASPIPSANFGIWWTGDLGRELLDGTRIDKWDPEGSVLNNLATFSGVTSINGSKANPCLSGDILGDWREEVIYPTSDSSALRLYTTTYPTAYRMPTLAHDPMYRTGLARQNAGYNQPPWPSFFLGYHMAAPPTPNIDVVER